MSIENIDEGAQGSGLQVPPLAEESKVLSRIALPLVAAYLAEMVMFNTTRIVVGQLGYTELAAVGLGSHLAFEILVVLMGLLSVVGVLVANAEGANDKPQAGHATRQGLIIATVIGVPGTIALWNAESFLLYLGQPDDVVSLSGQYLPGVSIAIIPTLWFVCFRNFVTGIAKTGAIMVITIAAVGVNYILTVALVYGRYGAPEMGVYGAGLATGIVSWFMFIALVGYVYFTPKLRGYGVFRGRLKIDLATCREIIALGIPVAGLVALEATLFLAAALISGNLGSIALATYEVLIGWLGVTFVIALGLAEAAMVRVAFGAGQGNMAAARQSGTYSMAVGVIILALLALVPIFFNQAIVDVFLDRNDPGFDDIAYLAGGLFYVVAVFQTFDGLQAIASRALRGIRDTIVPLWIAAFGYWGVGIGGGYTLTFAMDLGLKGIWYALAVGLTVTGSMLCLRFLRLTHRSVYPQPQR